jgi:hypothetical protein
MQLAKTLAKSSTMSLADEFPEIPVHDEDLSFVKSMVEERAQRGVPATPLALPSHWDEARKDRMVVVY